MFVTQRLRIADIAKSFGVCAATINNKLRRVGIAAERPHQRYQISIEEIRRMYLNEGLSLHSIAVHFGCSDTTIRDRVIEAGFLKAQTFVQKRYKRLLIGESELRKLYLEDGLSDMEISRRYGVCNITVANRRKHYGIKRDLKQNYVPLPSEELKRMYIDEKQSMESIAKRFGCGESTVRAHLMQAGLGLDTAQVAERRMWANKSKYTHRFICNGYRAIQVPGHPMATKEGYVKEHRYVAESAIGRYLEPGEQVHHINLEKLDNRIENLAVLPTKKEHALVHKYMERVGAYLAGLNPNRPEPLVFGMEVFWGQRAVTQIDLVGSRLPLDRTEDLFEQQSADGAGRSPAVPVPVRIN